ANLSDRYISDRYLPDKAIDLIDEAGSRMRIRRMTAPPDVREVDEKIAEVRRRKEDAIDAQDFERAAALRDEERQLLEERQRREREWKTGEMDVLSEVDEEEIAEVLSTWTGIPVFKLTEEETEKLLRMEDELHKRIISQDDAIKAVSKAISRTRAGLVGHLPRALRRGQDRAVQGTRRVPVRRRGRARAARHVRVHGEAHGQPADRLPARVRRLRGGRAAHRGGAPQAVLRGSVRRDREGAPGRVQHAPADPRGRAPHRRAGPQGRLQEHDHHHDLEPRDPRHPEGHLDRVRGPSR